MQDSVRCGKARTVPDMLRLSLSADALLPIGLLSDTVVAEFGDGSRCYVPITFRSVGDVYGETLTIPIGRVSGSQITKSFRIHFANGRKLWEQVEWEADGQFAGGLNIEEDSTKKRTDSLDLLVEIDASTLLAMERGFISSNIIFFENDPNDEDAVRLLVYGYK